LWYRILLKVKFLKFRTHHRIYRAAEDEYCNNFSVTYFPTNAHYTKIQNLEILGKFTGLRIVQHSTGAYVPKDVKCTCMNVRYVAYCNNNLLYLICRNRNHLYELIFL